MNRPTLITLHLGLASVFLPLLLLIPLSGGLYLLDYDGKVAKTEAFQIGDALPDGNSDNIEDFFRRQFKAQNIDFDFEFIRVSGDNYTFRPSSRAHYMATKSAGGFTVYKMEPDFFRRLIEIHKGHGPRVIQWLQIAFALSVILVSISGIYLAVTVPAYRKILITGFVAGLAVLGFGLL